ncbi:hypothetical protein FOA52_005791 [Chlamydomonas sp. UWO 241]|nr:hypothetical protein FOA52_005791 [Chlamydomonas sp. UWO 241]
MNVNDIEKLDFGNGYKWTKTLELFLTHAPTGEQHKLRGQAAPHGSYRAWRADAVGARALLDGARGGGVPMRGEESSASGTGELHLRRS